MYVILLFPQCVCISTIEHISVHYVGLEKKVQSCGESTLLEMQILRHGSEGNITTQGPGDDFVPDCSVLPNYQAFHLSAVKIHIYNNTSCQQTTKGSCLFSKNTNCSVFPSCSEVCGPCRIHMVESRVLTLKQLTDALRRIAAAPGWRSGPASILVSSTGTAARRSRGPS